MMDHRVQAKRRYEKRGVEVRKLFFLTLLCAFPALAQARPRDDAMSAAYRCAPIADSRQWLDCYYGAAQAQRLKLGLPPALSQQLRLVASPPAGGAIQDKEFRSQVLLAASRCYSIAGDRPWLDCYYGAAAPLRSVLGLPAPPDSPVPTVSSLAPGLAGARSALRPHRVTAQVASFSFDRRRNFTITLSNGQVWQQVAGDTNYAHWNKPPGTYSAIISPGFLGSTNLQIKGEPLVFKVRQVQQH